MTVALDGDLGNELATLRRDRPNRSAMARWLSGCPAATDAA
jgi:hypothetical protein